MASDKDRPNSPGRRRRPVEPRPLELEPSEVKDETMARPPEAEGARPAEEAPSEHTGQPEPAAEPTASEPADAEEPAQAGGADERQEETAAAEEPPAAPPGGRAATFRPGTARLAVAAIGGGLVVLVVMLVLGLAGLWPRADDPQLRTELAAAEARIAALEAAEPELPPIADPNAVAAIAERLETLAARLDEADAPPDLTGVEERLAALEAAPEPDVSAVPEDVTARLAALEERLDEVVGAVSDLAEAGAPDRQVAERVAQIEATVADRLSQIEGAVAEERGARQALAERIDRLETAIAEAEATADPRLARAAAGMVAVTGIARALETGQPYERELAAIRPLVGDEATETLRAHAETGLPSNAELAQRFADRTTAVLTAGAEAEADQGVLGWIASGARSLVRVRPAGQIEGDSRAAVVSRIEAALAGGDLPAARREWQSLDPAARQASSEWASGLAARLAADEELTAISAETAAILGAFIAEIE